MIRMPRQIFDFDPPDAFAPDAVGEPGDRTFYLRARRGGRTVTVALEKVQVALLAERIVALLDEVRRRGIEVGSQSRQMADASIASDESPIVAEDFRAGTLALAWEVDGGRVMVEARELRPQTEDEPDEIDDDDPSGPDLLRVHLEPPEALGFVERATELVAAGRPPCPLCGQPLDPQGHLCPRRNGYLN
jgi:uncharacterized repeat protein (TIGR03847 family)